MFVVAQRRRIPYLTVNPNPNPLIHCKSFGLPRSSFKGACEGMGSETTMAPKHSYRHLFVKNTRLHMWLDMTQEYEFKKQRGISSGAWKRYHDLSGSLIYSHLATGGMFDIYPLIAGAWTQNANGTCIFGLKGNRVKLIYYFSGRWHVLQRLPYYYYWLYIYIYISSIW